jgi:DNA-binding transcriptional MerR regulator
MNQGKDTPIYNLKAVVQETGLKPDTLRAWERRYGVPKPKRTLSGHRLYSQRDIDMLHWLLARQEDGLSISRAVEMWQHMQEDEEADFAPLPSAAQSAAATAVRALGAIGLTGSADNTIDDLTDQWVSACLNFNQSVADQTLSQAFALFSAETVCLELIQKGLTRIGEGWYHGSITVQQEHFASSLAMRRLETMLTSTPPATRNGRILIGNPPEEEHTFVPLMFSLLLRRRGWDIVYLGANVPTVNLEMTLTSIRPDLVILTAQQLYTAASLLEMSEILLAERIPLAFGGRVFNLIPDLGKVIPGYYLGARLDQGVRVVEEVMSALRVKLPQRSVSQEYRIAHAHFRERQAQIEADLWRYAESLNIAQRMLSAANANFSATISSALRLGNVEYIEPTLAWVEGLLLNHHGMPAERLQEYLSAYHRALLRNLDERADVLKIWLMQQIDLEHDGAGFVKNREKGMMHRKLQKPLAKRKE